MEFITADTHFFDENIIKFENRPFKNADVMNQTIIGHWNMDVGVDDTVYMLGDFFDFSNCNERKAASVINILNGKIILILGNHDRTHVDFYRSQEKIIVETNPIIVDDFFMLSHEPMYVTESSPYANMFGHVHANPMYKTVSSRSYCACMERHGYRLTKLKDAEEQIRLAANKKGM